MLQKLTSNLFLSVFRVARNGTLPPLDRLGTTEELRTKSPVSLNILFDRLVFYNYRLLGTFFEISSSIDVYHMLTQQDLLCFRFHWKPLKSKGIPITFTIIVVRQLPTSSE